MLCIWPDNNPMIIKLMTVSKCIWLIIESLDMFQGQWVEWPYSVYFRDVIMLQLTDLLQTTMTKWRIGGSFHGFPSLLDPLSILQRHIMPGLNSHEYGFLGHLWDDSWKIYIALTPRSTSGSDECRYKALQYCKILHRWLQELRQNINQVLDPQTTTHTSPKRASYGVSFVNICEKIDSVITAPHCIFYVWQAVPPLSPTQNGRHSADNIIKTIFLERKWLYCILIYIFTENCSQGLN